MRIIPICLLLITSLSCYSQKGKIDSLLNKLSNIKKDDTSKVNLLNDLAWEYSMQGDYIPAKSYISRAKDLGIKLSYQKGIAKSYNILGIIYADQAVYDSALVAFEKSKDIKIQSGDKKTLNGVYNNIGMIHYYKGDYDKALTYYYKSLKITEETGDKKGVSSALGNIGLIHEIKGEYEKALVYYFKAIAIEKELGDKSGMASSYNNIGAVYYLKMDLERALDNFLKSLKIKEELGASQGIANTLENIGLVYQQKGEYEKALDYYRKSLLIKEEIGDIQGTTLSYNNIGELYLLKKQPVLARQYQLKSLKTAIAINAKPEIMKAYGSLFKVDSLTGDYRNALNNYRFYIMYRDSVHNSESEKKMMQTEMQHEYEKKEAIAKAEQDKKDAISKEEKEKQQLILSSVIAGLLLVGGFSGFIYNRFRVTQKQKAIIEMQKVEVDRRRIIAEEQKLVIEQQKHLVEEKQKEILDSITYAKRIQAAILPPSKMVKEFLPDSFVLYKPKDIVAGDFYWMLPVEEGVLFAAADCTGHGVPGALVSVVCNNALNRSVREYQLTDPGKILDSTRRIVIAEFQKSEEEVKDGMDISLCFLKGRTLTWAGANNPLWILKGKTKELEEYKPDKQPIGKYAEEKPFTTHRIELEEGDVIYIFTDGFADQFGGEKGKKFKYSKLKELLVSISDEPMEHQNFLLNEAFEGWRGSLEQIDDVNLIGVRV